MKLPSAKYARPLEQSGGRFYFVQWLRADYATERRILEIVNLNCRLDEVKLVAKKRKPFDVLVEGLELETSQGDMTAVELLSSASAAGDHWRWRQLENCQST